MQPSAWFQGMLLLALSALYLSLSDQLRNVPGAALPPMLASRSARFARISCPSGARALSSASPCA